MNEQTKQGPLSPGELQKLAPHLRAELRELRAQKQLYTMGHWLDDWMAGVEELLRDDNDTD